MKLSTLFILLLSPFILFAQVDHWESIILPAESWRYQVPTAEPNPSWTNIGYDDASWLIGQSGFGYGDDDDQTVIEPAISIYMRKQFHIVDINAIDQMILSMDFDDAFVAYINGVEVARAFISGEPPLFDQPSDGQHEALLYQGIQPESFNIAQNIIENLNEGNNVLAIQVHNRDLSSSDLSAMAVLSVGINNSSSDYQNPPSWFNPPFEFHSSKLPVIIINTNGQTIVDEPKVTAEIGIIFNGEGQVNNITDPFNEYFGQCGIEIRGESSQSFPKKSYGFEMWDAEGNDVDTSFLNFPPEEDFILYGPYSDKSLLNNVLAMYLGNELGHYASRTRLVELVINDDYKGVYVVMEKIKRDVERVDISKLNPDEKSGDDLTGGYIFRIDKGQYDGWFSQYAAYNNSEWQIYFQLYYPDEVDIAPEQKLYIDNYVDEFEKAIASSSYMNSNGKHYLEYIDLRSFVDMFLINEYSKNVDAYRLSSYFHKDKDSKGGKIFAGPLWDFNLAFGNGNYCGGDDPSGWEYYQCDGSSPFWWHNMLNDELFTSALRCRWEELRQTTLKTENINAYLDSMTVVLSDARDRNFQRWPIMGTYVWPNSWFYANSTSHDEVMGHMKDWLEQRSYWLDNNFPGGAQDCQLYEPPYSGLPGEEVLGLENPEIKIAVYPNPLVEGKLYVESMTKITSARLYDLMGKLVFEEKTFSPSVLLDLSLIQAGIYLLEIRTQETAISHRIKIE